MKNTIFCIAFAAALAVAVTAPISISASSAASASTKASPSTSITVSSSATTDSASNLATATDQNSMEEYTIKLNPMFSNIDLTDAQKELIASMDNPFAEDYQLLTSANSRKDSASDEMPDRCGGDPRFQSGNGEFDPQLQLKHQSLVDARVEYLQKMSQMLTAEQLVQLVKNLDSIGGPY